MFLCPSLRLAVQHVPKTAGCALLRALLEYVAPGRVPRIPVGQPKWPLAWHAAPTGMHAPWQDASVQRFVREHPTWTYLAVRRNPWDRAVSLYHHCQREKRADWSSEREPQLSFREWLDAFATTCPRFLQPPQVAWIGDCETLRFEQLQHDFDELSDRLGIERTELPHENVGRERPHWSEYHDRHTIARVAEIWDEDVERLGYEWPEMSETGNPVTTSPHLPVRDTRVERDTRDP